MALQAHIDESACSAHGDCETIAPEIFRVDDVAEIIGIGPEELMLEAARICPTTAIRITDATGAQIYP